MKKVKKPPRCLASLPRFQPPATHVKLCLSRMAGQGPLQQLQEPPSSAGFSDWACSFYKKRRPHPPLRIPGRGPAQFGASGKTPLSAPISLFPGPQGAQTFQLLKG